MSKTGKSLSMRPRIRIYAGNEIALGPGKVELLRRVAETGSLSEAARRMKMSYMKAWLLVQVMNHCFRKPLVVLERGGVRGGGTHLTDVGTEALALYDQLEEAALTAMQPSWKRLQKILGPPGKKKPDIMS